MNKLKNKLVYYVHSKISIWLNANAYGQTISIKDNGRVFNNLTLN